MKTIFSAVLLLATVALAPAADQKSKAVAIAKAACACAEAPVAKKDKLTAIKVALDSCAECKCRSGETCACVQCKCVDAVATRETLPTPVAVVTDTARFILVTSPTCEPCHRMIANEVPRLRESATVDTVSGGYGVTAFPTIIYEVNGKEKWRTTGYTSFQTLLSLRGS
jgi:hypothetical protein